MKTPQQRNLSWYRAVSAALAFLCLFMGLAPCGNAAPDGPQRRPVPAVQVASQFAIADFDGDSEPDLATVQGGQSGSLDTHYWIHFRLSTGVRQTVGVTAPIGGLQITSGDVNGDSYLDVIVTTAWTNQPVAVLLNDGRGNFTPSDPSASRGAFWSSRTSWTCTTDEVRDAAAAFLSSHLSRVGEGRSRVTAPQTASALLIPRASYHSSFPFVASFLGRAPPSFLHHE